MANTDESLISLNKHISGTGFCSRREADDLIEQERVTINGRVVGKGYRVKPGDIVEIDGEPLKKNVKTVYIACNKPVGVTSTTDLRDKTNIITFLNHPQRIFPVGRLDKDSDGLILLTNDGDIVNKILRASNNHQKEYIVVVDKDITPDFVQQMSNGIPILGTRTKKCEVRQEGNKRFRITLTQGLNRQIRRMCEFLGYDVVKLTRVRIMNIVLGALPVGHWRYLSQQEIEKMNSLIKDSSQVAEQEKKPKKKSARQLDVPETEKDIRARKRKEAYLERRSDTSSSGDTTGKKNTSRVEKARREREKYLKVKKETEQRVEKAARQKRSAMEDFEHPGHSEKRKPAHEKEQGKKSSYRDFKEKGRKKIQDKSKPSSGTKGRPSSVKRKGR